MPDQPAQPAPTPTMGEAIAFVEELINACVVLGIHAKNDRGHAEQERRIHLFGVALSAMRAVEAGPVAWALVSPDGKPHTLYFYNAHSYSSAEEVARFNRRKVDEVRALYAFPSPDGGSAK